MGVWSLEGPSLSSRRAPHLYLANLHTQICYIFCIQQREKKRSTSRAGDSNHVRAKIFTAVASVTERQHPGFKEGASPRAQGAVDSHRHELIIRKHYSRHALLSCRNAEPTPITRNMDKRNNEEQTIKHQKLIEYGRLKVFTVQSKSAATITGESAHRFPILLLSEKQ